MSRENRDGAGNNTRPHGCGTEVRKSRTSGLARARYSSKWGVPRPGNHVQPGAGDTVREERGVGGGVEEVVRAVHDEGGCADVRWDLPCVVPVAGRQVAPLGMRGHSGVAESPVRPGVRCRPARRVHQLEQGPPRRPRPRPHQRPAHLVRPFNGVRTAGRCAPEYQGAHPVRMPGCELLGHAPTHGRPVHIGPADGESVEHRDHVQGEQPGAVGHVGLVALPSARTVTRCCGPSPASTPHCFMPDPGTPEPPAGPERHARTAVVAWFLWVVAVVAGWGFSVLLGGVRVFGGARCSVLGARCAGLGGAVSLRPVRTRVCAG